MPLAFGTSLVSSTWDPTNRPMYNPGDISKQGVDMWLALLEGIVNLIPGASQIIALIKAITGIDLGDLGSLFTGGGFVDFISKLLTFLNPMSLLGSAEQMAQSFITDILNPQQLLAGLVGGVLPDSQSPNLLMTLLNNVAALFGGANVASGLLDIPGAIENFIQTQLGPSGLLATLEGGILPNGQAPAIVQEIVDMIVNGWNSVGVDVTGAATTSLHTIMSSIQSGLTAAANSGVTLWNLISSVFGNMHMTQDGLSAVPIYQDAEDLLAQVIPVATTIVNTGVSALGGVIGSLDQFFLALTGLSRPSVGTTATTDTATQLQHLASTVVSTASTLSQLTSSQAAAASNGVTGGSDFEFVNAANLNQVAGDWHQTYIPTTTGSILATPDGHNASLTGGSADVIARARRTNSVDAVTLTDYQLISVVFGATITGQPGPFNTEASVDIYGRVNATETDWVRLNITENFCTLWYAVAGVETQVPMPGGAPACGQAAAVTYSLACGEAGSLYQYQIMRNGEVLFTWTDSSHVTQVGSTHRGWMWGERTGTGGTAIPAIINDVRVADNLPAAVVGTGIRVYRATTASQTLSAGSGIPGTFWDTFDFVTNDITWSGGVMTCVTPGWYSVNVGIQNATTLSGGSAPWQLNLLVTRIAGGSSAPVSDEVGLTTQSRVSATWLAYLNKGDTVQPGLVSGHAALFGVGDAVGNGSFFAAALVSGAA